MGVRWGHAPGQVGENSAWEDRRSKFQFWLWHWWVLWPWSPPSVPLPLDSWDEWSVGPRSITFFDSYFSPSTCDSFTHISLVVLAPWLFTSQLQKKCGPENSRERWQLDGSCPYRDRVLQIQTRGCHIFAEDTLCYLRYLISADADQRHKKGAEVRTGVTAQCA